MQEREYEVCEVLQADEEVSMCLATCNDGQKWLLKRKNGGVQQQSALMVELALAPRLNGHPNLHLPRSALVSDGCLCLVYEPCAVTLPEVQRKWSVSGFPIGDVRRMVYQLASAVAAMHRAGVVHSTLTPQAIMLREDGILKLGRLESAKMVAAAGAGSSKGGASSATGPRLCLGVATTSFYAAPEAILKDALSGSGGGGMAADVWAVGCIAAELAVGRPIFPGETESEVRLGAIP
jgi:serine/threonine protein kinase